MLTAQPYEDDPELGWPAPAGPDLPYEGVVVLTRARVAPLLRRVLVAPVTTTVRGLSTEVALGTRGGTARRPRRQSGQRPDWRPVDTLLRMAGRVDDDRWPEFCAAMAAVLAC